MTTDWLQDRGELVRAKDEREGTVIVGAGPTARLLAKALADAGPVWVVDRNSQRCQRAEEAGLNVVCRSALDEEILAEAQLAHARQFIALTTNPEVNVLAAQIARERFQTPEVNVLTPAGDASLRSLANQTGVNTLPGAWENIKQWDHWVRTGQVSEVFLETNGGEQLSQVLDEGAEGESMLPLILARNGQRVPLISGAGLNAGDRILALQLKHG